MFSGLFYFVPYIYYHHRNQQSLCDEVRNHDPLLNIADRILVGLLDRSTQKTHAILFQYPVFKLKYEPMGAIQMTQHDYIKYNMSLQDRQVSV